MREDPFQQAYAPPGASLHEDPDLVEMAAAVRSERRRQSRRLLALGLVLGGAGALVLWRVAVYEAATGFVIVKVLAVGAGGVVSGIVFLVIAGVIWLRS